MNKRKKFIKSIIICFMTIIIILIFLYVNKINNSVSASIDDSFNLNDEELHINNEINFKPNIINIALFGIDSRTPGEFSRADTIMNLTIDTINNCIGITSIMRDTYVNIPGKGFEKINHAFYGGESLAVQTINENFMLDIRDYITVDFYALEKIVDILGGIEIDIKDKEIPYINKLIKEINNYSNDKSELIEISGVQKIYGRQAVSYARIRKVGRDDFERTERQRIVLEKIISKLIKIEPNKYPKLISSVLPFVKTSLNKNEILNIAYHVKKLNTESINLLRLPADGYWKNGNKNGHYVLLMDTPEDNVNILHQFIYKNIP